MEAEGIEEKKVKQSKFDFIWRR